ncbi:endochitinase-like [Ziziphus jujuba]|uniref:Endochitinase-like n=1 Tax=Ziziphus jujuba TaxID=326968 RepID=A0ABM3ZSH9_ZIZJJ|nr:endochitinase-like [Ziziphus jujuba]
MTKMMFWGLTIISLLFSIQGSLAEQCGSRVGGATCPGGLCCSQYGWCGTTPEYCTNGCQSQCSASSGMGGGGGGGSGRGHGGGGNIPISRSTFDEILKHRNDCPSRGFYSYDAFIASARAFPGFGTTGDEATRKREIAAFLGQTSHETSGGWDSAPDGRYAWGYCYVSEVNDGSDYCSTESNYPCASGRKYFGRGPIQVSWNYNYGECGRAIRVDLLNNPDLVATDAVISFKTAIWFWMTPQSPKPSPHDVITQRWTPSRSDSDAGRVLGYGLITNIVNGGLECGKGRNDEVEDRIGFYKRYCDQLGVGYGDNLDCYNQRPFG